MTSNKISLLTLDLGNTRAKAILFKGKEILAEDKAFSPEKAAEWLHTYKPVGTIVSNTGALEVEDAYRAVLGALPFHSVGLGRTVLPFESLYEAPTLGSDRIAAVAGAFGHVQPPFLVVDAGTCLTYEVVDAQSRYLGGAISPGLQMRLDAMHHFTARLPQLEAAAEAPLAGRTTKACMHSGALNGLIFELEGYRTALEAEHPGLQLVLSGGAAPMLAQRLRGPIFAVPNLVPEGLRLLYGLQG